MTRDDIIKLAREAGFTIGPVTREIYSAPGGFYAELERFAALVAAAEREACAKVCEELLMWNEDDPGSSAAKAIRARGEQNG